MTLRVIDIIEGTAVDGPGLRTSIYFAGCKHHCTDCHNPHTWDFEAGKDMTVPEIIDIVERNAFNVTYSGGDPMFQPEPLLELSREIKSRGKTIWCYTGFTYEQLIGNHAYKDLLKLLDVLVDGPFVKDLADISLRFRGSSNQRIIDCQRSNIDKIVLWE